MKNILSRIFHAIFLVCWLIAPGVFAQPFFPIAGNSPNNEDGDPLRTVVIDENSNWLWAVNGGISGTLPALSSGVLTNDGTHLGWLSLNNFGGGGVSSSTVSNIVSTNAVPQAKVLLWHAGAPVQSFTNITGAANAAVAGDLVEAVSGNFMENNLLRVGVNYFLHDSVNITWIPPTTNTASDYWGIFDDRPTGPTTNVIGGRSTMYFMSYTNQIFSSSQNSGPNGMGTITVTNPATVLYVTANAVQRSAFVENGNGFNAAVVNSQGTLFLDCNEMSDPFYGSPLTFTNARTHTTTAVKSGVTGVIWQAPSSTHIYCRSNMCGTAGSGAVTHYGLWGEGLTTSDTADFHYTGDFLSGKIYNLADSVNFRGWYDIHDIEINSSVVAASATCFSCNGSGKYYLKADKMQNGANGGNEDMTDSGSGTLGTSNLFVWMDVQKMAASNVWFNCNYGTNWYVHVQHLEDLSPGQTATNNALPTPSFVVDSYPDRAMHIQQPVQMQNAAVTNLLYAPANSAPILIRSNLTVTSGTLITNAFPYRVFLSGVAVCFYGTSSTGTAGQASYTYDPIISGVDDQKTQNFTTHVVVTNEAQPSISDVLGPGDYFSITTTTSGTGSQVLFQDFTFKGL